jgi:hypothetical protein
MRRALAAVGTVVVTVTGVAGAAPSVFSPEHGKVNTADATPVGAQIVEFEISYAPTWAVRRGWASFRDGRTSYEHTFGLAVTYGLTPDIDATFATGYAFVCQESHADSSDDGGRGPAHGHGHTDDALLWRFRFVDSADPALELAILSGLTLPTGSHSATDPVGTSEEYVSWNGALAVSQDIGRATGNLEFGVSVPFGSGRKVGVANLAVAYHVLDWLQPELELNYERDTEIGPDPEVIAVTCGAVAPWGDGNRLTGGIQQAVWGRNTRAFTAVAVAFKAAF